MPSPIELAIELAARDHGRDSHLLPPAAFRALFDAAEHNWRRVGSSEYTALRRSLRDFDLLSTVAAIGGLLTVTEHQVGTLRLEVLQHVALTSCRGRRRATAPDFRRWIEVDLARLPVTRMEDPVEDVFVSNIVAPGGNFRLYEGIWESNDSALQVVIDALARTPWGQRAHGLLQPALALLSISEALADRGGTPRWSVPERDTPADEFLSSDIDAETLRARVHFSATDLESLGITALDLAPFVLPSSRRGRIRSESLGHTSLERHPLVAADDGFVVASPSGVSPAIRRYVAEECERHGDLDGLRDALRGTHSRALFLGALPRVDAPAPIGASALPDKPVAISGPLPWDEVHCAIDVDKAAVVIMLPDPLTDLVRAGLSEVVNAPELQRRLNSHIRSATAHVASVATGGGLVTIVYGGLGRGLVLGVPDLPPRWHTVFMSAADFATFAWSPDASLLRLWKLEEQRARLAKMNIEVPDTNGLLNTYAYWSIHHYSLCPVEMPYPAAATALVHIGTEFIHQFRVTERRLNDVHAASLAGDGVATARVRRLARAAFFPAMLERSLYVADEPASREELAGACEHPALTVWVWASKAEEAPDASYFLYRLWEAVLSWLDRLVPEVVALLRGPAYRAEVPPPYWPPVHVRLAFANEHAWRELPHPGEPEAAMPTVTITHEHRRVAVLIPFGFVTLLRRPTNDGERALLEVIADAILSVLRDESHANALIQSAPARHASPAALDCVARTMRGADTRHVHLFEAERPTDRIAALKPGITPQPRFVFEEDLATWTDGLAWTQLARSSLEEEPTLGYNGENGPSEDDLSRVRVLTGRRACTQALGNLVDGIWAGLRTHLQDLDGPSLAALTFENLEQIAQDRDHWRRTARALQALYGDSDDVSGISTEREGRRATASAAGRVLIEMAVCTSPMSGGRPAALSDLDHLTAGVSSLIGLAGDSDAIHGGLAAPELRVFPNGMISTDRAFVRNVVGPFSAEFHASAFRAAVDAYAELYRRRPDLHGSKVRAGDNLSADVLPGERPRFEPEFTVAYKAEFGLTPGRFVEGLADLLELGLEGEALVVTTTRGTLAKRLARARQFDASEIAAFFGMVGLVPRLRWDVTPPGFRRRDWEPWRFRRRLSVVARPLAMFGSVNDDATPVMYGLYHLGTSVSYLFESVQSAWLPTEFFRSEAMTRYRGRVADAEGAAFTEEVAVALRGLGWQTLTELQMSTLGAPSEFGDIDVVAWRDGDPRLLLVECKRLQPARTIGEIAEVLKQFRGEEGDRLGRHLRRCAWIRDHSVAVARHLDEAALGSTVMPLLVTNRDVPMRFRTDLPLSPNRIVPVAMLADCLEAVFPE